MTDTPDIEKSKSESPEWTEARAADGLPRARLIKRFGWVLVVAGVSTSALFTNCDGGFKYDPKTGNLESLGDGSSQSGDLKITTFNPAGMLVSEGQSLDGGVDYRLVATGTGLSDATLAWQMTENSGACVLRNGASEDTRYVMCDQSGRVSVQVSASFPSGVRAVASVPRTTAAASTDACGASTATRVVFRIPAGTGTSPWNSSTSPVLVFVGQTLRICNNDTRGHRLHTGGNPCPHQPNTSQPGQFYDCAINNTTGANATSGIVGGTYDHDIGTNAAFYIRVLSGQALYADAAQSSTGTSSCASCHNPLSNSSVRGSSFAEIKNAIATVPQMAVMRSGLSDDEIRAIEFALRP
jgi:hypothetical protein